jgi:aspartyl-tRNA synthetase
MIQSQVVTDKKWTKVEQLKPALAGQTVLVRGYLQLTRDVGKGVFVLVRSSLYTIQGVTFVSETVSQAMVKYIAGLPLESVVDMEGTVTVPDQPVEKATQQMVEIKIAAFHCVSKAKKALPFVMEDACRPDAAKEADIGLYDETEEVIHSDGLIHVGQKVRLDNRWIDLRTPANQSIMRIESMIGALFRESLLQKGFIEMHAPKLIGGSSEGGSDVFTLDYFGQQACLAMSPQLHKVRNCYFCSVGPLWYLVVKGRRYHLQPRQISELFFPFQCPPQQMAAACSGFERVFTTGPVFRAENR